MPSKFARATRPFTKTVSEQYWAFQVAGWTAMALLSYLSLTIWYNPGQWVPILHTLLQSLIGLCVSHPLRHVALTHWDAPIVKRALIIGGATLAASLVWASVRLATFIWLTGELVSPQDWGGWIFGSITVFGAWTFCYHAIKYSRQSTEQHQLAVEAQSAVLAAKALAQHESLKRLEAESLFKESQLRMLKYQLNPHFLFNALNSVSALVQKGEKHGATDMLARIGDFLRASLDHGDDLSHSLAEELEILDLYLGIEKVRFGDRLHTEWDVSAEAMRAEVPALLLQPLVENSVKFAVGKSLSPTTLRLAAWLEGKRLNLCLSDDGPGIAPAPPAPPDGTSESTGIGLRNVKARLSSLYGEDFEFDISGGDPAGVIVRLSFPDRTQAVD